MYQSRTGSVMVYCVVAMVAMIALTSLAVDYGRVQIVKTQLRAAADAAARAAASDIGRGVTSARTAATSIAAANNADGKPVVLDSTADIEFGAWDYGTRSFILYTGTMQGGATAVRVTARRTADRNDSVPLSFGMLIGKATCDVTAMAVATVDSSGPGIVGLQYINLSDKKTNSYKSSRGKPTSFENRGNIYSNGNITLKNGVVVNGDAQPGIGCSVSKDSSCIVTGSTAPLTFALTYDMPDPEGYATVNDNAHLGAYISKQGDFKVTSGTVVLPGGHYYVRHFNVSAQGNVSFQSSTTIWVTGTLQFTGGITTANDLPANLRIRMVSGSSVNYATFNGNTAVHCDFYGPMSPVTITGNADYFGRVIAQSIDVSGSGELHYDETCVPIAGAVAIVQ